MWECEWTRLKDTSSDIRTFVAQLQFTAPLNPRDAFCGGRTNAVKLYHHVTPRQKIHYIDVTSLYPWVEIFNSYNSILYFFEKISIFYNIFFVISLLLFVYL